MDFEIISQECSLDDPLPKLPNGSAPLNKMATRAKNRQELRQAGHYTPVASNKMQHINWLLYNSVLRI